ncbi:cholesterol esterase [Planosporangium thailandense]|uniref:Cholesterol esterase n=1 Tax=Planosporangium thailandense TaxID=765197 RepID=A0ABX0XRC8_9ACTN|nr:DUF6230 family protein [Planosporangium thailandense]NJC68503.1 cholesterol esterase [Planosporangium thailandense]
MPYEEVSDPSSPMPHGKVRWRRFTAMMVAAGAVAGTLVALTAQGVLAAQFSLSGMPFTVTATRLDGTGFEQFATLDHMAPGSPNEGSTGGQLVLVVSAIDRATLTNLCQSIDLGGEHLKITAGTGNTPVTARTMVVDSDLITGDASFDHIDIGQDASTLKAVPGVTGNIGVFGQQARTVTIKNLRQNNFATTAAQFTLPGLHLSFTSDGC